MHSSIVRVDVLKIIMHMHVVHVAIQNVLEYTCINCACRIPRKPLYGMAATRSLVPPP